MEFESPHRLFRAMVLMGSSLALGCGGVTSDPPDGSGSAPNGNLGGGTGGTSSSPSVPPGNVEPAPPNVGVPNGGSGMATPAGGATGVAPSPTQCPPPQWDCAKSTQLYCAADSFALPADCGCDFSRPLNGAACAPGQHLTCRWGGFTQASEPLDAAVGFDCRCVPSGATCREVCNEAFPEQGFDQRCVEPASDDDDVLCGCAIALLK